MAKSSWQQQRERQQREALRAQREAERLAAQQKREAERAQAQTERENRARYLEQQKEKAERLTTQTNNRVNSISSVLRNGLKRHHPLDFESMRLIFQPEEFRPGTLDKKEPPPLWDQFAPPQPGLLSRLFGGNNRRERAEDEARSRFEHECNAHRQREESRLAKLKSAQDEHAERQGKRKKQTENHNTQVSELEASFRSGEQAAVERCLTLTLEAPEFPEGVPNDVEVGYRTESRQVLVVRELPDTNVIPTEVSFRYVKSRDVIESAQRKAVEVKQRYAELIAQLALLTLRDIFVATTADQVSEITVNCHLSTTDRATGKDVRPCLLTVSASRESFNDLVLDKLEPSECLRHLNALMSPHPYDVEPITPIFEPDMSRFRLTEAHGAAADLDSRTVLVKMKPIEFEHLVRELFEAMGMQSWVTQASRDDGVDGVAVNPDPIMGGVAVIQAKRYANVVPTDAVRALSGVMSDKNAGTGILVTTSYFGKSTHDFKKRNERIRLIEGPELKHLIAEHLGKDVLLGAKEAPSRRA